MLVTKVLIYPVKKRIFCPKTTKFGPKLAFLVDMGQVMQVFSVPCWWVGWWLGPRGLYLARHLFTLFTLTAEKEIMMSMSSLSSPLLSSLALLLAAYEGQRTGARIIIPQLVTQAISHMQAVLLMLLVYCLLHCISNCLVHPDIRL